MNSKKKYIMYVPRGFTLVELMVVIAIIGVLAAALFPAMGQYLERSKMTALHSTISELRKTAELYKIDNSFYPLTSCESRLPVGDPSNCDSSNDPFLPYGGIHMKMTPWGGEIAYGFNNIWGGAGGDAYFVLNDDSRYQVNDDAHRIPSWVLQQVDIKIDDGNLGTGSFMGDSATGSFSGTGEGLILLEVK